MIDKEFDCVELQRKIRDEFYQEAEGDFNKLIQLLDKKILESDVYNTLIERKKEAKLLVTQ